MAGQAGTIKNGRRQPRKLKYFYLDGKLHCALHIDRPNDVITTWSYPDYKRVGYTYSDVRRVMEPAFTTVEVGKMVNRSRIVLERALTSGAIEAPQMTYGIDENKRPYKYMWHEKDIMALHAYLKTIHFGRPRKDGLVNAKGLPNARELRAMIRQQPVMGYLDKDGKFTPTWLAEDL